jgi:hypothetical protein
MKTIFLGLATLCLLALGAAFGLAYAPPTWTFAGYGQVMWHMTAGLFAAFLLLALHGFVILNYFIATGKAVDQELAGREEHPAFKKRARKLKGRTFPFATMSALFIVAAAVLGGLAYRRGGHAAHWIVAYLALALNLFSFKMEYKSIKMNMALLDEVRVLALKIRRERQQRADAEEDATETIRSAPKKKKAAAKS